MAIIFPLVPPTSPGPRKFKLAGMNLVGVTESPFTFEAQIQQWGGERWELEIGLPPMFHDEAEQWIAFLLALRGQVGTFVMGDPMNQAPSGSASGMPIVGGEPQIDSSVVPVQIRRVAGVVTMIGSMPEPPLNLIYFQIGQSVQWSGGTDLSFDGLFYVASVFWAEAFQTVTITWNQTGPDTAWLSGGKLVSVQNVPGSPILSTTGWAPNQTNALVPGDYIQLGNALQRTGQTQRLHKVLTPVNTDANGTAVIDIFPTIREVPTDGMALVLNNAAGTFRLASNRRSWDADYTRTYGIDFKAVEAL